MNLARLLGTEFPLIQAPMAGAQGGALAIAVCNSGGLGSLPAAMLGKDELRSELALLVSKTTRPYNVNFFCHEIPRADAERERAWRDKLGIYYREFGIDPSSIPSGPGRFPFDREVAEIIAPFRPPIVSFHFGLPSSDLLAYVRAWGAKILSTATTLAEALWLEARGVDAIIAQGLEAGGHRGHFLDHDLTLQGGTLPLVRQLVRAVKVPVIAAGGIADRESVRAAMALGAAGVQVGTAYLLCSESLVTSVHRAALKSPDAHHTALTNLFTGRPARGIVNRFIRECGPLREDVPAFPLATASFAPLRQKAEGLGRGDFSPLWAGQNLGTRQEVSAAELTQELAGGF